MTALLVLMFAAPAAFADTTKSSVPPPPVVTSPTEGSRLPHPDKITIKGTAPGLTKVSARVRVSHVQSGRRVYGHTVGPKGASVTNGQWQVDLGLPSMQRGWVDVRYTITAVQYWDKRPEQHHVTDKPSAETTVDVFPQAQPEPLPVAPPAPVIQTPTSGTLLKREPNIHITGTGTPGNQVQVSTQLFYAVESNPKYEHKNPGSSWKGTIDKNGKWDTHLGYGGFTASDYVNPRVRIVAKEVHRESASLVSHETIREVPVEVPAKREPTEAETRAALIGQALPHNRVIEIDPRARDLLLRPASPRITAPADKSSVGGELNVSGTAAPDSNLQVSVKRRSRPVRESFKPRPDSVQDLGTFTTRTGSNGEWKIRPVTLPPVRGSTNNPTIEVSVVELLADGNKSSPHTVTAQQDH
ncbi:MAG: hypothetical protein ACOH1P_04140 [Lysobacter sp.]